MHKKALIIVAVLLVFNVGLLIVRLSSNSHALETSDESRIKEIKTSDEVKEEKQTNNNEMNMQENFYLDLVSLETESDTFMLKNTKYNVSENLQNDLNSTISNYPYDSSYLVVSLTDGMSFGYNIDTSYSSGSTIKAAYALYIYKLVADGKANLEDKIAYEAKFYNKGTGNIKNSAYGTEYTVKDLINQMIHESDNVAYLMLLNKYKWDGFNEMLDDLGTPESHLSNTSRWGKLSCRSSAIIWQEIYRFSKTDAEGQELYDLLLNAKYNYFKEILPDNVSASKTGFTEMVVHETGIVNIGQNPYIVIILSSTGGDMNRAYNHVKNVFAKISPILEEYNNFKMNEK